MHRIMHYSEQQQQFISREPPFCRTNMCNKQDIYSLTHLIGERDWKNVDGFLSCRDSDSDNLLAKAKCCPKCKSCHHCIFYLCQKRAPLSIIKKLVSKSPQILMKKDCMGRHPLHIATKNSNSLEVIRFLAETCPQALDARDRKGKTPLHLAIEYYEYRDDAYSAASHLGNSDLVTRMKKTEKYLYELVSLLLLLKPECIVIRDSKTGQDPLEYAIVHKRSHRLVRKMQVIKKQIHQIVVNLNSSSHDLQIEFLRNQVVPESRRQTYSSRSA